MFGKIKRKAKSVTSLDEKKTIRDILNTDSIKAQVVDLNQHQLYDEGLLADGTPTGEYAPITKEFYKPLAASEGRDGRTDHITLKDTGEFYQSMEIKAVPEGIHIVADYEVSGGEDLRDRFPNIAGLTPESIRQITPEIRDGIVSVVKKALATK